MTPVWGRTEGTVKRTGRDPRVLPKTVLYDPLLLIGMPASLACPSGMNALAHCVEALYAPGADPLTSLSALEGVRLIAASLPLVAAGSGAAGSGAAGSRTAAAGPASSGPPGAGVPAGPGHADAVRALLWACCLAGRAFGTAGGSLHHSLCHLLGGFAGLPHADTHAVVLPHVLAFVSPALGPELDRLAAALGCDPADVPGALFDLGSAAGTPAGLRALGLPEAQLPAVADALAGREPVSPRPVSRAEALALITAAWTGSRPVPAAAGATARTGDGAGPGDGKPMSAADLTSAVIGALQSTPDLRLRQIMMSLIRHLHGFVADVRLTQDEWLTAIRFLTATGQISSDRRQEFILLSDTLGVSMLVDLLAGPSGEGVAGFATESTVLGPFYVPDSPERGYGASIAERPSGELAWVTGRVTDIDGRPSRAPRWTCGRTPTTCSTPCRIRTRLRTTCAGCSGLGRTAATRSWAYGRLTIRSRTTAPSAGRWPPPAVIRGGRPIFT